MIQFVDIQGLIERDRPLIEAAIEGVLQRGSLVLGPEVERCEAALADYFDLGHEAVVSCGNGLDAIRLMLLAAQQQGALQPGDAVLVPGHTFIASLLGISHAGLTPLPFDVDPHGKITREGLEEALALARREGLRVSALLTVHLYGECAATDTLLAFCRENTLLLFEDCAQCAGARDASGKLLGTVGQAAAFSFYPTKPLAALGDGGVMLFQNPRWAKSARLLANYGKTDWYHHALHGFNSRLDAMQAAIITARIPNLEPDNHRRAAIASIYREGIRNPKVALPAPVPDSQHVYHLFPIFTDQRDNLQTYLEAKGIPTGLHYPVPPHWQECYKELLHPALPGTERVASTELSLPMHALLSDDEAAQVVAAVNEWEG